MSDPNSMLARMFEAGKLMHGLFGGGDWFAQHTWLSSIRGYLLGYKSELFLSENYKLLYNCLVFPYLCVCKGRRSLVKCVFGGWHIKVIQNNLYMYKAVRTGRLQFAVSGIFLINNLISPTLMC